MFFFSLYFPHEFFNIIYFGNGLFTVVVPTDKHQSSLFKARPGERAEDVRGRGSGGGLRSKLGIREGDQLPEQLGSSA